MTETIRTPPPSNIPKTPRINAALAITYLLSSVLFIPAHP
jgi:hypothetical protein